MQRTHSTSARACPHCGQPVPRSRYLWKGWYRSEWPCPRCGTRLGFDLRRRAVVMLLVGGLAGGVASVAVFILHFGWWIVAVCAVAAGALAYLLERVRVVPAAAIGPRPPV